MHTFPSFQDGFVRRALVGTLFHELPDGLRFDYELWRWIACAILGLTLFLLYRESCKSRFGLCVLIVFFISPFGAYLFHEIGYLDQVLMVGLFAVARALAASRLGLSVAILCTCMFVHELALFFVVPMAMSAIYDRVGIRKCALVLAPVLLCTLIIYVNRWVEPDAIGILENEVLAKANFKQRQDFWHLYMSDGKPLFRRYYQWHDLSKFLMVGHTAFFISFALTSRAKPTGLGLCVVLACVAPLGLGFMAWDVHRWLFLAWFNCVAALVVFGHRIERPPIAWVALLSAGLFMHMSEPQLFDRFTFRDPLDLAEIKAFVTSGLEQQLVETPKR